MDKLSQQKKQFLQRSARVFATNNESLRYFYLFFPGRGKRRDEVGQPPASRHRVEGLSGERTSCFRSFSAHFSMPNPLLLPYSNKKSFPMLHKALRRASRRSC